MTPVVGVESPQLPRLVEHLLRPRAHAKIFGEIAPAHDAGMVDEEFGGPGNVASVYARSLVEEVITANGLEV